MGMTQVFSDKGEVCPVTVIKAGPCVVIQKKTLSKDGYNAIQLGFGEKKQKLVNKPLKGHLKKANSESTRYLREIKVSNPDDYKLGDKIDVASMFKAAVPNMNDVMKQNPDLVKNMISAVQNTSSQPQKVPEDPTQRPTDASGRKEMKGPGFDLSQLMGGISMPPPPPMNTTSIVEERQHELTVEDSDDDLSDIVSIAGESTNGEVKEVRVSKGRGRKGKKKNEINL